MQEIMTIEEVAKYLQVEEKTIYDWAQKGTLPGGKIGTTWRFKTADIEKWLNDKLKKDKDNKANNKFDEDNISLIPKRVLISNTIEKNQAIHEMINILSESKHVININELKKGILERENIMSTGIGLGIGVPHVRSDAVSHLIMTIGIFKNGIMNYQSLDEKPVKIVCMIASRSNQHKEYLNMLSNISTKLKQKIIREQLLGTTDKKFICDLLLAT